MKWQVQRPHGLCCSVSASLKYDQPCPHLFFRFPATNDPSPSATLFPPQTYHRRRELGQGPRTNPPYFTDQPIASDSLPSIPCADYF